MTAGRLEMQKPGYHQRADDERGRGQDQGGRVQIARSRDGQEAARRASPKSESSKNWSTGDSAAEDRRCGLGP